MLPRKENLAPQSGDLKISYDKEMHTFDKHPNYFITIGRSKVSPATILCGAPKLEIKLNN